MVEASFPPFQVRTWVNSIKFPQWLNTYYLGHWDKIYVDEHSQVVVSDSTILFQVAARMLGPIPPEGGGVASPWKVGCH